MDIAFIGKAGAGKDAAAAQLVAAHGFTRIAFADPLKEMALRINPAVEADEYGCLYFLADAVRDLGWDDAKLIPEVRRLLQVMGQTVRGYAEDFWLEIALGKWAHAPIDTTVITDVRYPNEAKALAQHGFRLIRIIRPGAPTALSEEASRHASETALDDWPCDATIVNGGSLAELALRVDALLG